MDDIAGSAEVLPNRPKASLKYLQVFRKFANTFGFAVGNQVVLSAANFLAGLTLIRRAPEAQYGYYVLINSGIPLLALLQSAFVGSLLAIRVGSLADEERRNFVGGVLRGQRLVWMSICAAGLLLCALAWMLGRLENGTAVIAVCAVLAALAWLVRDFFRMVLFSYRRPSQIFWADVVFTLILIAGVWLSTLTPAPAAFSALAIAISAVIGARLLSRALWRHDPWNIHGSPGALIVAVRVGQWAALGTAVHWLLTQGYTFVVAERLDASAVAAIATARLLLMPIGMFSAGIGTIMFPTAVLWLKNHGKRGLLRRVNLCAIGMACLTLAYAAVAWSMRDWIFANILKRNIPQRDELIILWSLMFLCTVVRDQLISIPMAYSQFKRLAALTMVCGAISVSVSFTLVEKWGAAGGLLGPLSGEFVYVLGVLLLIRLIRDPSPAETAGKANP
jgi:O-antigen/teichoic acid export membrane protein